MASSCIGVCVAACSCSDDGTAPEGDASAGGGGSSGHSHSEEASTGTGGATPTGGRSSGGVGPSSGGSVANAGSGAGGVDASTDTGGAAPSDAGPDADAASNHCSAPQKLQGVAKGPPFALFVMSDRSSSMVTDPNPEGWATLTAAVTALVNDPNSTGMSVGFGSFPPLTGQADCATGANCGGPIVPIAPLPGNAAAMIAGLQAATPVSTTVSLTPLECGLRGLVTQCRSHTVSTGMPCSAVLFTDGAATQCDMDGAVLAAIAADGFAAGVKTFLLATPGSNVVTLNELARAGGTSAAVDAGSSAQSLATALRTIRDGVRPATTPSDCEWVVPPPPAGEAFYPMKVNVSLSRGSGPSQALGFVSHNCRSLASAWHYDSLDNPRTIVACPATCTAIRSASLGTDAFITFGCETVPAPN